MGLHDIISISTSIAIISNSYNMYSYECIHTYDNHNSSNANDNNNNTNDNDNTYYDVLIIMILVREPTRINTRGSHLSNTTCLQLMCCSKVANSCAN